MTQNVTLNNREFKNVYSSRMSTDTEYKELRFNFDFGIVSYSNKLGKTFVFDRFE